jgi:hypothetical protein
VTELVWEITIRFSLPTQNSEEAIDKDGGGPETRDEKILVIALLEIIEMKGSNQQKWAIYSFSRTGPLPWKRSGPPFSFFGFLS